MASLGGAGNHGLHRAAPRSPASPGAIRAGSTLIEEVRFATVSPPEGDDSNPRSPSAVSSLHAGARDTTRGANDRICHQGANAKLRRRRDSLITAETSLIARFNSLQGRKKFPVSYPPAAPTRHG